MNTLTTSFSGLIKKKRYTQTDLKRVNVTFREVQSYHFTSGMGKPDIFAVSLAGAPYLTSWFSSSSMCGATGSAKRENNLMLR